ncbi:MAG TPA: hypothetical protein VHE13_06770 [Opitutus sp.]|nr:hypothetical protein [Opitutus sp.]
MRIALGAFKRDARYRCVDLVACLFCRLRIRGGPYRGMRFLQLRPGSSLAPKLIGSYEAEIIPVLDWVRRAGFEQIVNIGSAEGYHAIGLIRDDAGTWVDAFEIDARRRAELARSAAKNGVAGRVRQHGVATPITVRAVLAGAREPFLLVDIEGGERDVLDPAQVPGLRQAWMLVELHPGLCPDVEPTLQGRFAATHRLFRFDHLAWPDRRARARKVAPFHWLERINVFHHERRGIATPWLLMIPRAAARPFAWDVVADAVELGAARDG